MASSKTNISLTDAEANLRQFLLHASSYIGSQGDSKPPQLRITGGWVRDKLLGITSHDIDIGIDNMTGFKFGTLIGQYSREPEAISIYGKALGTLAKIEANPERSKQLETGRTRIMGFDIDLVNLRKETYSEDSRNPIMEFGTPEEDALRRDATVNAMFYNLQTSTVEDFTGRGFADMKEGIIKTPLPPLETFTDDPLRVLRCIRFASRLSYRIATEDKIAMADAGIKSALRIKISRERVGVEITKMLQDPNAYTAVSLIDELTLYNTIFTDPTDQECKIVETKNWSKACKMLSAIVQVGRDNLLADTSMGKLRSVLLRDPRESFLAWTLVCLTPWAREPPKVPMKGTAKKPPSPAYLAAREGIKADNKICRAVNSAVDHLQEVIDLKRSISAQGEITREVHGHAIRKWGSDWRSVVIFALLTEVMECDSDAGRNDVVEQYARWMRELEFLDLLDVDKLEPIVKGDDICKAFGGIRKGPWLKQALDIAMDWQLRNPQESEPSGGVEEVRPHDLIGFSTYTYFQIASWLTWEAT